MQDYIKKLLYAINQYDADKTETVENLKNIVCWISDKSELKKEPIIAELLYIASQKMRVFGYNKLNNFKNDPCLNNTMIDDISDQAISDLYHSNSDREITLDKTQKEVIDLYQRLSTKRLLVSAPTSYGKTFLMRELIYINRERYKNLLLVFPTVALLLENAGVMSWFVKKHDMKYRIIKTVDDSCADESNKIFVFTPERALQLLASFPDIKLDFFFFDEIYKIDEDYCNDELDEKTNDDSKDNINQAKSFLDEERGKTFRIALYLLSKRVEDYYLAGPNLNQDSFGIGMKRFIEMNHITVKEIDFEPTLRITVNAFSSKIEEKIPTTLINNENYEKTHIGKGIDEKIKNVISYIDTNQYGQTLMYCTTPSKAIKYSNKLSKAIGDTTCYDNYPDEFKSFIDHIEKEYDVDNSVDDWSLIQVLKKGFGMHHGKLPKYIQREILEQFNKHVFKILFCTSTIVEGVNTDAQNMIILNSSKGKKKLSPFDIKNIKGRAGRYYHNFIGRVFYMNKELQKIEKTDMISLDFVTYSNKKLDVIDLDNALFMDLLPINASLKKERENKTRYYLLPEEVFEKNRTVSKENQEMLLQTLMKDAEYCKYHFLFTRVISVDDFLQYAWMKKIIETFEEAGLIDHKTSKKFIAVAYNYSKNGFMGILQYEIKRVKDEHKGTIDDAYSNAFKSMRGILEHKIPKILSLFESILAFVAEQKGDDASNFNLSHIRRYYETGVKSLLGEALIEYGFPTDAIRRIEEKYKNVCNMDVSTAKQFCRNKYQSIKELLDPYENQLFIKAIRTL